MTSLINLDVDSLTNEKAMTRFSKRNQLHKKNSKVLHRNIFPYAKKLEKMKKKMKTKTEKKTSRFYIEVSSPVQGVCHTLKRIGGRWWPKKVKLIISLNKVRYCRNTTLRSFSHFLSIFCSYCVISCTGVVKVGTTAKFCTGIFRQLPCLW